MRDFKIIVVYKKPKDYPNEFVARACQTDPDTLVQTPGKIVCKSTKYKDVERVLARTDLFRVERMPSDDHCIFERWI